VVAFEVFEEELGRVLQNPYRWKWVIISLHSGLQGMMVLALQGSHGLHALRPEDAKRWLEAREQGGPLPGDLKLDSFLSLYKKIKSNRMLRYVNSKKFVPIGTQGDSIKKLNSLRNEFIHFTPKVWCLELIGLPDIASDCLSISEFLALASNNVLWAEPDLYERMRVVFISAKESLRELTEHFCNS
jgi:hypothetical protein